MRTEALDRALDRIERWLQEAGEKEVASAQVGERVMNELTALDSLAAVRFASVFRSFQSADEYAAFFESVTREGVEFRRAVGLAADGADQVRAHRTCFVIA